MGEGLRKVRPASTPPEATVCIDNFHVVQLATKALDEVRRLKRNELLGTGCSSRRQAVQGQPLVAAEKLANSLAPGSTRSPRCRLAGREGPTRLGHEGVDKNIFSG